MSREVADSDPEKWVYSQHMAAKPVRRQRGRVPPIYFFADPFGFSGIHLETLGRLLAVKRWEALLTFMVGAMRRVLDQPDLETPLTDFLEGHRGASAQALSAAGDPG